MPLHLPMDPAGASWPRKAEYSCLGSLFFSRRVGKKAPGGSLQFSPGTTVPINSGSAEMEALPMPLKGARQRTYRTSHGPRSPVFDRRAGTDRCLPSGLSHFEAPAPRAGAPTTPAFPQYPAAPKQKHFRSLRRSMKVGKRK